MLKIAKAELFRACKGKAIKVILLVSAIFLLLSIIPFNQIIVQLTGGLADANNVHTAVYGYEAFSAVKYGSFISFFVPFLVINFYTVDLSRHTIRSIFGQGFSRTEIFVGKYIAIIVEVIIILLLVAFASTILYTIINGWGIEFSIVQIIDIFFLAVRVGLSNIAYASLVIMLSLVIRSSALIVILYFGLSLIESLILSIFIALQNSIELFGKLIYLCPTHYMNAIAQINVSSEVLLYSFCSISFYIAVTALLGSLIFNKIAVH